jgi:hypothetical protein
MKESFVIYKAFYEPISELSDEDLGQLFRYIFLYQINQIEPPNTSRVYMAFQFFKNQFRLDNEKYLKVVNRNKTNGLNGGRPKTQDNPKNPVGFNKPKKADNEKDNDKDINIFSFNDFWNIYPSKIAKDKCKKKFDLLTKAEKETIKATLPNFLAYKPFKEYNHPNPLTYLNQKRWEDVIQQQKEEPKEETEREYRLRMFNERNGLNER